VQTIQNLGYSVPSSESVEAKVTGPLAVLTGTCLGTANGACANAFFFVNNQYIGTDTSQPSMAVTLDWQSADTVALTYPIYQSGDAACCPSGGLRVVRFFWNGGTLVPLDPLPVHPNRTNN
jgi:hypothetical protein